MDDRTSEIKEGAGLEESRINTEFIELLQKWSSPVLLILALIVGAYAGNNFLKQRRNAGVNEAFRQHAEITETANPSPASLSAVAAEYRDTRAIGILAKLRHAEILMRAVRIGAKPGSEFETDEDGLPIGRFAESDRLTDEDRERYLSQASGLYTDVLSLAGDGVSEQIHRIAAQMGLASIAEVRGETEAAEAAYRSVREAAEIAGFPLYVRLADARLASVGQGFETVTLPSEADLPDLPEPETPELPDASDAETNPGAPAGPAAPEAGDGGDAGDDADAVAQADETGIETGEEDGSETPDETGGG